MADEDGKINGKYPIIDDILPFIWCRKRVCPCDTLINYKIKGPANRKLPDSSERKMNHCKTDENLCGLYKVLQGIPTEDPPVFLATDSNNIPFVGLTNVDDVALVVQQRIMKDNIATILAEQEPMQQPITHLREWLERSSLDRCSADVTFLSAIVEDARNPAIGNSSTEQISS